MKRKYITLLVILGLMITTTYITYEKNSNQVFNLDKKEPNKKSDKDISINDSKEEIYELNDSSLYIKPTANLEIRNEQNTVTDNTYTYKIYIEGLSGAVECMNNHKPEYLVFDAKGNTIAKIKNNTTLIIYDVEVGKNYKITQEPINGFKIEKNEVSSIVNENNNITSFNNVSIEDIQEKTVIEQPEEKEETNPETIDKIDIVIVSFIIITIILVSLKRIRVKRY